MQSNGVDIVEPNVFIYDSTGNPKTFEIKSSQNTADVGTYVITYSVELTSYPGVVANQLQSFTVNIEDPCEPPHISITATT